MQHEQGRFVFSEHARDLDPGFPTRPNPGEVAVGAEAAIDEVLSENTTFIKLVMGENQEMHEQPVAVRKVADKLNFGNGSISVADRLEHKDDSLSEQTLVKVDKAIKYPEILVEIGKDDDGKQIDDDGCGDGRSIKTITRGTSEVLKRSLDRAKIFGGGLTMTVAATVGLGKTIGHSLQQEFEIAADTLKSQKINFGAHTDDHAHGENCGCGAIDKAPEIIENANKFREHIEGAVKLLSGPSTKQAFIDEVFNAYKEFSEGKIEKQYSGRKVSNLVAKENKVNKELEGLHREVAIVINTIKGMTVNQQYIREITDGNAQVFAVDEWRIRDLSQKLFNDPEEQQKAYISMLVYTLSTAGTLTKGDMPVYLITPTAA